MIIPKKLNKGDKGCIKINYYSNTSLIFLYKFKKCLKV